MMLELTEVAENTRKRLIIELSRNILYIIRLTGIKTSGIAKLNISFCAIQNRTYMSRCNKITINSDYYFGS